MAVIQMTLGAVASFILALGAVVFAGVPLLTGIALYLVGSFGSAVLVVVAAALCPARNAAAKADQTLGAPQAPA